jgi:hypothetical protein
MSRYETIRNFFSWLSTASFGVAAIIAFANCMGKNWVNPKDFALIYTCLVFTSFVSLKVVDMLFRRIVGLKMETPYQASEKVIYTYGGSVVIIISIAILWTVEAQSPHPSSFPTNYGHLTEALAFVNAFVFLTSLSFFTLGISSSASLYDTDVLYR